MLRSGLARCASAAALVICSGLCLGQGQEVVYRSVSSEKLESILKGMDISYQKATGKKDGIYSYDFERQKTKVRMYNYSGEDLWIEADFTEKATLDVVNRWNMRAKFSRAVLVKDQGSATISLESQIDCTLGITEGMVRHFIRRFDDEILAFGKFLK